MKLYTDHIKLGERIEHTRFKELREHDHRPTYEELRVVESESDDHAYLVARVACLDSPFNPDETDVAEDRVTGVPLCSCDDGWFRATADFEIGERAPSEFKKCKHYRREFRAEEAEADEQQESLGQ